MIIKEYIPFSLCLLCVCLLVTPEAKGEPLKNILIQMEKENNWRIAVADNEIGLFSISDGKVTTIYPRNLNPYSSIQERGGYFMYPSFSPDGNKIAISGTLDDCSLIIIDIAGTLKKKLFTTSKYKIGAKAWSPKGSEIAYIFKKGYGGSFIYKASLDSNSTELITGNVNSLSSISWSPDGRNLVYQSSDDEIAVIDVSTKNTKYLAKGTAPSWSAAGLIAYRGIDGKYYVIDPDGSNKKFVLDGREKWLRNVFSSEYEIYGPLTWSPDGRFFLYARKSGLKGHIYKLHVFDLESGKHTRIGETYGWMYAWGQSKKP